MTAIERRFRLHGRVPARLALALWVFFLAAAPVVAASLRVEIEPNSLQDPAKPMSIEVGGVPAGTVVRLQVLQDCDGDNQPDLQGKGSCKNPLYERDSTKAGGGDTVSDRLDFPALARAGQPLPVDKTLWLRAYRPGSPEVGAAMFSFVQDPCNLLQSVLGLFGLGPCGPGVAQAARHHRGAVAPPALLEVRRIDVRAQNPEPVVVPRTQGATGVAWADRDTFLVTIGESLPTPAPPAEEKPAAPPARLAPGLWRLLLSGGEPRLLWAHPAGDVQQVAAPLSLPGGRIAFVRQSPGDEAAAGEDPVAMLSVWDQGKVDAGRDLALPYKIHQLLASDSRGESLLALTLGSAGGRPAFLRIDLKSRTVVHLGYDSRLYQAAFLSPAGPEAAVAFEDNTGQKGWELALVGENGQLLKSLQSRAEDDLRPAWRPGGGELAYLGEVARHEVRP